MTLLAALFMATAVTAVTALAAWCYYRVLRAPADDEDRDPPE